LPDGHPLEISTHSIHLPLIDRDATVLDEGGLGVVQLGRTVTVGVISNLVVIPDRDPGELLVRKKKILIGAVSCVSGAVVVQGEDGTLRLRHTADGSTIAVITVSGVLVDVVTKMENVVDRVLACRVSVGVEEAKGCFESVLYWSHVEYKDHPRKLLQE